MAFPAEGRVRTEQRRAASANRATRPIVMRWRTTPVLGVCLLALYCDGEVLFVERMDDLIFHPYNNLSNVPSASSRLSTR